MLMHPNHRRTHGPYSADPGELYKLPIDASHCLAAGPNLLGRDGMSASRLGCGFLTQFWTPNQIGNRSKISTSTCSPHTHTQSRMHLTHTQTAKTCAPSTLCFTLRDARALASLLHKSGQKAMDRISLALNLGVSARAMQRPAVPPSNRYHKKWSGPKARTHNWDHARHPPLINTRPTSKKYPSIPIEWLCGFQLALSTPLRCKC